MKWKGKVSKKEKGVSEVLGSILVLLITVMLFSTVFYYVGTMPTPQPKIYAQFDATLHVVPNGTNGYCLNITVRNVGGENLVDWRTMFIVVIDFTAKHHMLSSPHFANQPFDKDGKFSQGESFYYNSTWDHWNWSNKADIKGLNIGVTLMDKNTGSIIWSSKLQGISRMSPVLVGLTSVPSMPILGKPATFRAIVFDPSNPENVGSYDVYLDFSDSILKYSIYGSAVKNMSYSGNNVFTSIVNFKTNDSLNIMRPYKVKVWINDGYNNISYPAQIYVSRGTSNRNPDLYVDSKLITLGTKTPTHGDNVQVSVTIENLGGSGAKFQLRVLDEYPGYKSASNPDGVIPIKTNFGSSEYLPSKNGYYTVAAAGQTTISFIWENVGADDQGTDVVSKVSGTHRLIFQVINITPVENPNKYPDTGSITLTVLPSILLVDDDGYAEGSTLDTSRYYKYYLDTAGYKYDVDKANIDITQLKDDIDSHDLVIWETGYKKQPLTPEQASILQDFVVNKGGSLWLISQEISAGNLKTVLDDGNVRIASNLAMDEFKGLPNGAINLTLSNGSEVMDNVFNRDNAPNGNDTIYITSLDTYNPLIEGHQPGAPAGTYTPVAIYKEFPNTGKIVFMGFQLSRAKHYYTQDFVAYRILKWLANITGRAGNDLAVEDMIITPRDPLYKQPVHISVVVSNNGGEALSSEVLLEVDGIVSLNINTTNPNSTGVIPPDGGFVVVNFTWIPTQPGKHVLTAIVDPYNRIKETNEENNIINTEIVDTNVFVHFSTLVVYNSTQTYSVDEKNTLISALQDLGYRYKTLDLHSTSLPKGYEDGTYFAQYNLILWADAKIGKRDINAIMDSLSKNPNTGQLFIGSEMAYYIYDSTTLKKYLGISSMTPATISSESVLYGINNVNSATNGLSLIISSGTTIYNISATNSKGLFREYYKVSDGYRSLENESRVYSKSIDSYGYGILNTVSVSGSKYGILPFDMEDVTGLFGLRNASVAKPYAPAKQARAWLIFRMFRWFGYSSSYPELATFSSDIQIVYGGENPNLPPIIGRSYMLRTKVYNYGSEGANTIVRFYDDFEWIGSKTVYVPGGKYAQVEIDWTPMFAGSARHIRIIVDPLNEVQETKWNGTTPSGASSVGDEILNFNNEAIITKTVYYFWDNMENGAGNWEHEATVLDINGESPLDFINRRDVNTTVIGDWDWSLSGDTDSSGTYHKDGNLFYSNDSKVSGFTDGAHHSAPSAFWMPEAPRLNVRKPIDVIFVIDTSGSMTQNYLTLNGVSVTRLYAAQVATMDAISQLTPIDRVAIYGFNNGNGPIQILSFTGVTSSNYTTIKNAVWDDLNNTAGGGTPLYDTVAAAVEYMDSYGRSDSTKGIVVLTDGLSNSDYHYYKYAPGTRSYETETGPIQSYTNGDGLLNIPYNLMTISIAPDGWDGRLAPIGNSSTGRISMALFDSNGDHIKAVFSTFITLLQQRATGGLRAISPSQLGVSTINGLGTVVFSDGFRAYASDGGSGTPDDANTPGFLGKWTQSGFTIASNDDRNYYYKSQSGGWTEEYWVAQTDTTNAYLEHEVYPQDVLSKHYPGTYSIVNGKILFWVGVNGGDNYWPDATIKVYAHNTLLATLKHVLDGSTSYSSGTGYSVPYSNEYEIYFEIPILPSITSLNEYNIKIEVVSTKDTIGIDDVMVVYSIDYTPPSSNSGGGGTIPSDYSSVIKVNVNYTYLITPPVDVSGAKKAMLTFWTKYWMTQGTNGGIMYLWGSNSKTTWTWDKNNRYYLKPTQSYTGNLKISSVDTYATTGGPVINGASNTGLEDAENTKPYWCFNGRSGGGTFGWDYIEVDLTPYLSNFNYIRIVFMLVQFGGISPSMGWNPAMGWYLDDVKITVTSDGSKDLWQLHNFGGTGDEKAHSGDYAWAYGDSKNNWALPKGVDSSLITKQIDLTTARTATLSFWIRFNLNSAAGVPPATVRVEVSDDNGMTWQSITYGVRIGWGASGTGGMAGTSSNGQYGWVKSNTLSRISCDLSGWAGKSILIRFRVVTNNTNYNTYATSSDPYGVFIDDVQVYGEGYASTIGVSGNYLWTTTSKTTSTPITPVHKSLHPQQEHKPSTKKVKYEFNINYGEWVPHISHAAHINHRSDAHHFPEFQLLARVVDLVEFMATYQRT